MYVNSTCRACDKTHSYVTNSIIYHERNSYHMVFLVREFDMSRIQMSLVTGMQSIHMYIISIFLYLHTHVSSDISVLCTHQLCDPIFTNSIINHERTLWFICIMYTCVLPAEATLCRCSCKMMECSSFVIDDSVRDNYTRELVICRWESWSCTRRGSATSSIRSW